MELDRPLLEHEVSDYIRLSENRHSDKMHIKDMITHLAGVDEAPKMFEMLLHSPAEAMGVVLDWQKG